MNQKVGKPIICTFRRKGNHDFERISIGDSVRKQACRSAVLLFNLKVSVGQIKHHHSRLKSECFNMPHFVPVTVDQVQVHERIVMGKDSLMFG